MPYVVVNPVDGQEPEWRAVGDSYQPAANEVLLTIPPQPDYVWDAASQTLRPRTTSEALAKAKSDKVIQIREDLNRWYLQDVRSVEGDVTVYKKAVGAVLTTDENNIFNTVNSNYTKRTTAVTSVRNATTVAQVNAVAVPTWDRAP